MKREIFLIELIIATVNNEVQGGDYKVVECVIEGDNNILTRQPLHGLRLGERMRRRGGFRRGQFDVTQAA